MATENDVPSIETPKNWKLAGEEAEHHSPNSLDDSSNLYIENNMPQDSGEYHQPAVSNYRWTPCPEWDNTGRCKYNDSCYRRHGPDDLRVAPLGWEKKRSLKAAAGSTHNINTLNQYLANTNLNLKQHAPHGNTMSFGQIGSPPGERAFDSYSSGGSPGGSTVTSPHILSPTITSPTLPHPLVTGSPRDPSTYNQPPLTTSDHLGPTHLLRPGGDYQGPPHFLNRSPGDYVSPMGSTSNPRGSTDYHGHQQQHHGSRNSSGNSLAGNTMNHNDYNYHRSSADSFHHHQQHHHHRQQQQHTGGLGGTMSASMGSIGMLGGSGGLGGLGGSMSASLSSLGGSSLSIGTTTSSQGIPEKPWIWQPCRHWADSGSCRYGDSCKYRHGPEDRRERPAPRPTSNPHLLRSNSNSSMESGISVGDSIHMSRPNINLQPIGAQITSPNASLTSLPSLNSPHPLGNALSSSSVSQQQQQQHQGYASQGSAFWDLFTPYVNSTATSAVGRFSPPIGEASGAVIQNLSDHLVNLGTRHTDPTEFQNELNTIQIQTMIAIQLQRESFLPSSLQESMRSLLHAISVSSNPREWQQALSRVLDFLSVLMDHLFNKFVSVNIASPSSSFGQLPIDIPSKVSHVQPYIGSRLSGSITELYDLGTRAAAGLFAPSQEEVITILEQLRRVAASTSKSI